MRSLGLVVPLVLLAGCWDFARLATLSDVATDAAVVLDAGLPSDADVASTPHDLAGVAPADLAGVAPADLAGVAPADLAGVAPADLAGVAPADLASPSANDLAWPLPSDLGGGGPCTPGAACATGSPGICSTGHITCAGDSPTCTPDSRPAAQEGCFDDTDDDCDGHLNNGCPDHLELGPAHTLAWHGGSGGGSVVSVRCPAGSFVLSAGMWGNPNVTAASGIQLSCGTYTLVTSGAYSLSKAIVPGSIIQKAGIAFQEYRGISTAADCAGGLLAGHWSTSHEFDSSITTPPTRLIAGFGAHCGAPTLVSGGGNQLTVRFDSRGVANEDVCYRSSSFACIGTASADSCGTDEVLVGFDLHLGDLMDSMAAVCAPLVTVYK
jgi:hypothetical protein